MKQLFIFLFISLHSLLAFTQANDGLPRSKGKTYAVVVGISNYKNLGEDEQLQFADKDATVFANYLRSKAGGAVPEENIKLLLNEDATYSNIYEALKWLLDSCQKNDLGYFYFSGHGSLENITNSQEGYLISYNTLPNNFAYNAVRIGYLNDVAATLSDRNNGKVIIITDACHSGSAVADAAGTKAAGDLLRKEQNNEIRITSCRKDQKSNEDIFWGGGRGVFSYYLVKGLTGEADKKKDGTITLSEMQQYLDSSFEADKKLPSMTEPEQRPVLSGNNSFKLAYVDEAYLASLKKRALVNNSQGDSTNGLKPLAPSPAKYFFGLFQKEKMLQFSQKENIEDVIDFAALRKLQPTEIPAAVIKYVKDSMNRFRITSIEEDSDGQLKRDTLFELDPVTIRKLENKLQDNSEEIKKFNDQFASLINNRTQEIINYYLKGDAAEMERRQYYNINRNGFDVYLQMFDVALKLAQPGTETYRILQLKQHYFAGVAARLKIPTVEDPQPLIDTAMAEEKKALALELKQEPAAYIRNELGNLYLLKKEYKTAKEYYLSAIEIAPKWVMPWANLVALYNQTKEFDLGFKAANKADSLQHNFQGALVNTGMLYKASGNYLFAEEKFRKAIQLNSRYYLPFEGLAYVYMNTTQYALADSFFYESEKRKKGFHFGEEENKPDIEPVTAVLPPIPPCFIDNADLLKAGIIGKFVIGLMAYEDDKMPQAEKIFKQVIAIDKTNPLAYHYLGKILYEQKRWAEAEIIFRFAKTCYRDTMQFREYVDSIDRILPVTATKHCIIDRFTHAYYEKIRDIYFLASTHKYHGHFTEAEKYYRDIIELKPYDIAGYYQLWTMLEQIGRYKDAEDIIYRFGNFSKDEGDYELATFYKRMIQRFPDDADWYYKAGRLYYRLSANPRPWYKDSIIIRPDIAVDDIDIKELRLANDSLDHFSPYAVFTGIADSVRQSISIGAARKHAIAYFRETLLRLHKDDDAVADINYKIGQLYDWLGWPEKACVYYKQSVDLTPYNGSIRLKLVDDYAVTYQFQPALEQLDSLYKRGQLDYEKYLLMSRYCIHAGRFTDADSLLKTAKAIYPFDVPEITDLRGRRQLLSNNAKQALPFYKTYLDIYPNDCFTMYTIGKLYARMNDRAEALKWLERAISKGFVQYWVLRYDKDWNEWRNLPQWISLTKNIKPIEYLSDKPTHESLRLFNEKN